MGYPTSVTPSIVEYNIFCNYDPMISFINTFITMPINFTRLQYVIGLRRGISLGLHYWLDIKREL